MVDRVVVYTLTQFPDIEEVTFAIDGQRDAVFSSEGVVLDGPQNRLDYVESLPRIFLDRPGAGARATSPVSITGMANSVEANVLYEITSAEGAVLAEGFTTATCGTGCWGEWGQVVKFNVDENADALITVFEDSAVDGSRINALRYPVTLVPGD